MFNDFSNRKTILFLDKIVFEMFVKVVTLFLNKEGKNVSYYEVFES
jgi:hypothetical protein